MKWVYDPSAVVDLDFNWPKPPVQKLRWDGPVKPVSGWIRRANNGYSHDGFASVGWAIERRQRSSSTAAWGSWQRQPDRVYSIDKANWWPHQRATNDGAPWNGVTVGNPFRLELPLPTTAQYSDFQSRLFAAAQTAGLDAGTMLAELKPTLRMLQGSISNFAKFFKTFAKGNVRSSRDELMKNWLAARFGWLPLLMDAEEMVKVITGDYAQLFRVVEYDSYGLGMNLKVVRESNLPDTVVPMSFLTPDGRFNLSPSTTSRPKISTTIEVMDTGGSLRGVAGIECLMRGQTFNPVSTLWELVPWSFVVDRFIAIGDFLANLVPTMSRTVRFIVATARRLSVLVYRSKLINSGTQWTSAILSYGGIQYQYRTTVTGFYDFESACNIASFERRPLSLAANPSLQVDISFTWKHFVDYLSLAKAGVGDLRKLSSILGRA